MTAIDSLKCLVKKQAEAKRVLRERVSALKWKTLPLPSITRDSDGRKISGKKALKAFRRPETGPERDALRAAYQFPDRAKARATLLAYGLLQGMPYASMESRAKTPPVVNFVLQAIHDALGEDKAARSTWTLTKVQSLLTRTQEAA